MKLTDEQFKALAPYEENFITATKNNDSRYSRHPGSAALDLMQSIYTMQIAPRPRLNKSCSHCILSLIHDMGIVWLADKAEIIARENDRQAVILSQNQAETIKKEIKTRKPRKKKDEDTD